MKQERGALPNTGAVVQETMIPAESCNSIQVGIADQSSSAWVHDTDRPISSLRSAKDLQGSTMKRVKPVEDLNTRIIRAQGIVGGGVTTRICIWSSRAAASRRTAKRWIEVPARVLPSSP